MVVRMRRNRSQTAQRRSHQALISTRLAKCDCGALRIQHRACPQCGKYNGKVVINMVAKASRDAKRLKRREKNLRAMGYQTGDKQTNVKEAQTPSSMA